MNKRTQPHLPASGAYRSGTDYYLVIDGIYRASRCGSALAWWRSPTLPADAELLSLAEMEAETWLQLLLYRILSVPAPQRLLAVQP